MPWILPTGPFVFEIDGTAVINHEEEMPHFPNYELGGIFRGCLALELRLR